MADDRLSCQASLRGAHCDWIASILNATGAIPHLSFDGSSPDQVFANQTVLSGVLWLHHARLRQLSVPVPICHSSCTSNLKLHDQLSIRRCGVCLGNCHQTPFGQTGCTDQPADLRHLAHEPLRLWRQTFFRLRAARRETNKIESDENRCFACTLNCHRIFS